MVRKPFSPIGSTASNRVMWASNSVSLRLAGRRPDAGTLLGHRREYNSPWIKFLLAPAEPPADPPGQTARQREEEVILFLHVGGQRLPPGNPLDQERRPEHERGS